VPHDILTHHRREKRHMTRLAEWGLLTLVLLALIAALGQWQTTVRLDRLVQDATMRLQYRPPHPDIVLVAIDEQSIAAIGRWPWRRALHAELLNQLGRHGPAAIGLDILFTEEDRQHPLDDALLTQALRQHGPVVLPIAMQTIGTREQALHPIPEIAAAANQLGHVRLDVDTDGITRAVFLREGMPQRLWPAFGVAMLAAAGDPNRVLQARTDLLEPHDEATPTPLQWQRTNHNIISFAGEPAHFPTLSYIDVLRGDIPAGALTGKLVLVGATATGIGDVFATPAAGSRRLMPGIEVNAHVLDGLLQQRNVTTAGPLSNQLFNLSVVLAGLLGLLWLRPLGALVFIAVLMSGLVCTTALAPLYIGVQLQPGSGLVGLALIYPLWSWRRLNTAADNLGTELARLAQEPSPLPSSHRPQNARDFLDRRIDVMELASIQLTELQNFISTSLQQLPDPTLVLDTRGEILLTNMAAARHFGTTSSQDLRALSVVQLLRDVRGQETGEPVVTNALLARQGAIHAVAEDYQGRTLLLRCVPFQNAASVHSGWLLTLVDLTDSRKTQSQRDQALRFISHDIRAPQAAILTLMELHRTHPGMMSEDELIQRVERQARSALELAESFIYLTHAQAHQYKMEEVDLAILLDEAMDDAWALANERRLQLNRLPGPDTAPCIADPVLIRRAISNVLNNAIKFAPTGSTVSCGIHERETSWRLSVHDDGPGIDKDKQAQLFQPFQRLHGQSHPQIKGLGLGLTFVHTVLQRHGGQVLIDSDLGMGCTFTLVLPSFSD
jgi:CHASE2 domain-containing sensor protein/signal transduction histidine kinase